MTVLEQVDNVKDIVNSHRIVPFNVADVTVQAEEGKSPVLHASDRFSMRGRVISSFLSNVGLKENLGKNSFDEPTEKWGSLRNALDRVGHVNDISAVVGPNGDAIDIIRTPIREEQQLNYDDRIDSAMDAIEDSNMEFHEIHWNGYGVSIATKDTKNEVNCGGEDIWQAGININLGHNRQEFAAFYLRLLCANGMTTKENYARRACSASNIGNQFINFTSRNNFQNHIKDRVRGMQCRASVAEVQSLASCLNEKERDEFLPFYDGLVATYGRHGMDITKMPKEQAKRAFTNEKLYDVFNIGTALATHKRDLLGRSKCNSLNKASTDMFVKGPHLATAIIDPYNN